MEKSRNHKNKENKLYPMHENIEIE